MTAAMLLDRLEKVRARGPSQWSARCPAHDDKGPSLSVKETTDGRVLIHCFAGCDVDEVVGALGMNVVELFPARESTGKPIQRRRLLSAGQALDLLHDEAQLIALCAANIGHGINLTDNERARCLTAAGRINYLRDEVRS